MIKYGIDVSRHNGVIDWNKVKSSGKAEFAILRAGYGKLTSQKDTQFESYYQQCQAVGIPVGAYWYSYAMTAAEAREEAKAFLEVIQGKKFDYPVYLDLEEQKQFALGKATCSAIAGAFLEIVQNAGYFTGIYSSKSGLENCISEEIRKQYTVWVAHVNVSKTTYAGSHDIWQYSWKGRIDGISGDVDCDCCYQDFPSVIRNAGLNGFSVSDVSASSSKKFRITVDDKTYSGILDEE